MADTRLTAIGAFCSVVVGVIACAPARVTEADLVATWTVQAPTTVSSGALRQTLELRRDQAFVGTALPRDLVYPEADTTPISVHGRWKLTTLGDAQVIQLDVFLPEKGGAKRERTTWLWFSGSGPELALYYVRGDLENDVRVVFARSPTP